jgi:hypothetical protein
MPPSGFEPAQAAAPIEGAIQIDGAKNIVFDNCEFSHIGTYGIWFRKGCKDNIIRHCYLSDLGAGGIRIGESSIPANEFSRTENNTVENNILLQGGRIFPCAVGIWIGHSALNRVLHNEIGDFYYTGISAGWRWGYGESLAKSNTIAFNNVHHIGWGILSDMGGIYTLGPSQGTVVTNNVFHDIYSYSYGGWGMYTDEEAQAYYLKITWFIMLRAEVFINIMEKKTSSVTTSSPSAKTNKSRQQGWKSILSFFERNIVYYKTGILLAGPWDKVQFTMASNCFYNITGAEIKFTGKTLQQWQELGKDKGSIIADPYLLMANITILG